MPTTRALKRGCLSVLITVGALATPVQSLDPSRSVSEYGLDTWSTDEGLPQSSVTGIVQGPRGYLWVATLEGVARFDGVRFQTANLDGLAGEGNRVVTALEGGTNGRVWAGTLGGGLAWSTGESSGLVGDRSASSGRVWSLYQDAAQRLWIGRATGLSYIENERVVSIEGLDNLTVQALDGPGIENLWIGTSEGLRQLTDGNLTEPLSQLDAPIRAIHRDRQGALWLGTTTSGLYRWQTGVLSHWTTADGLPNDYINALFRDRDGNLWIATRGGVVRREDQGFSAPLLAATNVLALHEDREGSLWLGTQTAGLNRLRDRRINPIGRDQGLADEVVSTVTANEQGAWIGTTAGGIHRLSSDGRAQPLERPLPSQRVLAALATTDSLWIATDLALVERHDSSERLHHPGDGLPKEVVLSLFEDREGRIWAGTNGGGVAMWNGSSWSRRGPKEDAPGTIYAITQDSRDAIWLGTQGGLVRLDGEDLRIWTQQEGLPSNLILSLHADERGVVWAGTFGGGLLRVEDSQLAVVTKQQGLYDHTIYSLLADESNGLWMCSNRGLFRVDRSELDAAAADSTTQVTSRDFDHGDGMPASECNGGNQPAAARLANGQMAFATLRGLAVLEPSHLAGSTPPPNVAIEELRADGRTYATGTAAQLPAGVRHLEIDYTALSFLNADRIRFRYRLVGYDDQWTEAGTRRTAFFTGLGPDDYRLEVIASGRDGVWGTAAAPLTFSIAPYVWQTDWFPILLLSLAGVTLTGGHRWRTRQLKAQQQELEQRVAERTDQLAEANRELARLAAEDGLTGLSNHRTLQEHLRKECRRSQRDGSPLSFLLLDLDSFKLFNDTYGHQAGDDCLQRVAAILAEHARRPADLAARYGGEELALVLPATDHKAARALGESVRLSVEGLAIPHRKSEHRVVTVSLGVATTSAEQAGGVEPLIAAADGALYRAKGAGRNQLATAADS